MTTKPSTGLLGGIEAGGTKFICGISDRDGDLIDTMRIPTRDPETTLRDAAEFFEAAVKRHGPLAALSLGSFGPLSLRPAAADFGHITSTPKPGWSGADLVGYFRRRLDVPVVIDTDVNCSATGEYLFGSGRGLETFCYATIGTGIGVGMIIDGKPHGGANHPEAGHIRVPRAFADLAFEGHCPFHGDCLEGLACGPAMEARWGKSASDLPDHHPAWPIEAEYIAGLCTNLTYLVRPDRIILGGGVMQRPHLYTLVRRALVVQLAGYDASIREIDLETYIAEPTAGASAGLTGALAMAYYALEGRWPTHWRPDLRKDEAAARPDLEERSHD